MHSRISVIISIKTLLRNSAIFIMGQFILICSKISGILLVSYTTNAKIFYKKLYQTTFLGFNLKAEGYQYPSKL